MGPHSIYLYTQIRTYTHRHKTTHTNTPIFTNSDIHTHTHTQPLKYINLDRHTQTQKYTYIHKFGLTFIKTQKHKHIHKHTNRHIYEQNISLEITLFISNMTQNLLYAIIDFPPPSVMPVWLSCLSKSDHGVKNSQ